MKNKFDLFNYRILTHAPELKKLSQVEMITPVMAIYHPTYLCNHNCPGCDFREENKKYKTMLSLDESNHILEELVNLGVGGIEFSGGGEPLMDKNVTDQIRRLGEQGIETGLLTNGSFLSGDMQRAIIENNSYVRVSLESGSNKGFQIAKGLNDDKEFPRIIKNIRDSVSLRDKIGSDIDISIKYTIGAHNYHDMENAARLAVDLGVDSIQFKTYQNVDALELIKDPLKNLEGKIGTLTKTKKDLENIKKIYGGKGTSIMGNLEHTPLEERCWTSPLITTIDALGDVYLCSYYRHRQDTHKIGNLLPDKSFKDIWGSERHLEAIKNTNLDECNKYDCRFHKYNKIAKELIENKALTKFI